MFLLAIALHAAPLAAPSTPPVQVTRVAGKRAKARRARARSVRMNVLASVPAHNPDQRYRLPLRDVEITDAKDRAVRSAGTPCGVTGAPVCPSKGVTLVDAPLDGPDD